MRKIIPEFIYPKFFQFCYEEMILSCKGAVKGPLHLAKFAIANIGQVLVQVLTQYLVQVFHFSGIFIS